MTSGLMTDEDLSEGGCGLSDKTVVEDMNEYGDE